MDLAECVHLTSSIGLILAISAAAYRCTRIVVVLVGVFGPDKLTKRALEVLQVLGHDRQLR